MTERLKCPVCKREWVICCEQAESIRVFKMCMVCLSDKKIKFDPTKVQTERTKDCFKNHNHKEVYL